MAFPIPISEKHMDLEAIP